MKLSLTTILALLFAMTYVLNAQQNNQIHKKIGFGVRVGVSGITADDLTKTGQKVGAVTGADFHYDAMDAIELLAEFSYGYNDVQFILGEGVVTRIFERSFIAGFRFYPIPITFGKLSPFFSFGAGYYEWFFTNNRNDIFYSNSDIQKFRGEDLAFHSIGLNAGLGLRYHLSNKFTVDGLLRYHFIQSKDNRGTFGTEDENEQSYDVGLGLVFLLPVGQQ